MKDFEIGYWTDEEVGTGVTVILSREGAVGGVCVAGGAPATRETDLLKNGKLVEKVNAVVLSGGSAFGLEASTGVMQYLHEQGVGYLSGKYRVPIVVGASLFDLEYRKFGYPDKEAGYAACVNAKQDDFRNGNVGAGMGATVGKMLGMEHAMKGGLGCETFSDGNAEVAFVVAVNALGDVKNGEEVLAGLHLGERKISSKKLFSLLPKKYRNGNTTIGCLMTNVALTREQANALAERAIDGYRKAISPAVTEFDGDAIFVVSSGKVKGSFEDLCALAPDIVAKAVCNSISPNSKINAQN